MWIHTDALDDDLFAALPEGVALMGYVGFLEEAGSRTHARKVRVHLGSDSETTPDGKTRKWSNSGKRGAGGYRAATYDEWGWFLAALFEADPTAKTDGNAYDGIDDFHAKTEGKYKRKSEAQKAFDALPEWKRLSLAAAVFKTLEYDGDGNPGSEWSSSTTQSLGELFAAYGVTFTVPGSEG
jgi:hypothetical protein